MDRLRKAFEEVREGMPGGWPDDRYGQPGPPPAGPHPARPPVRPVTTGDRPGSLWEAGSVGDTPDGRGADRPRNPNRVQRQHEPPQRERQPRPERQRPERPQPQGRSREAMETQFAQPSRRAEIVPLSEEVRLAGGDQFRPSVRNRQLPGTPLRTEAARLSAALQSPQSLRTAILLREVLDPPIALRDDRDRR